MKSPKLGPLLERMKQRLNLMSYVHDYIPKNPAAESAAAASDSLTKLLHLPFEALSEGLKKAALDLKNTVYSQFTLHFSY